MLRSFCHAVHPNFANVDVTANMSDSEGSTGPAQPATASVSTVRPEINFNNRNYSSWRDARDECTRLSNRGTSKVWARLKLVGEDEEKPFQLCCRRCGASCQLRNIAKWQNFGIAQKHENSIYVHKIFTSTCAMKLSVECGHLHSIRIKVCPPPQGPGN
jgi:hypothetical protein